MYLSVTAILLGEVLLTRSRALAIYWAVWFAVVNVFVMAYEERGPDGWKPAKVVLIRLQKVHDAWKSHGTVTLSGEDAVALRG